MDKKNALKKKTKPVPLPSVGSDKNIDPKFAIESGSNPDPGFARGGDEDSQYNIVNQDSQTRRPGMSPEEHEFINRKEKEAEPATEPNVSNYTGKYGAEEVNSFSGRLAEIVGKRESKGEPVNLVKQAESQKDYSEPYAKNISDLLKRYQEASEAKAKEENKGGAWSMVVGNALGPEAGRATLQAWQSGADEGVENLDRQQRAQQNQIKSDDSLFALARKARAADPNSPLSKALTEYERKTTGFGVETGPDGKQNPIPGLSAQDALDSGKGVINPVFSQLQQNARTDQTNQTRTDIADKNRDQKTWQAKYRAGVDIQLQKMRNATAIAVEGLRQKFRTDEGASKMAQEYGSRSVGIAPSASSIVSAKPDQLWIPAGKGRTPTPQGQKRFQEINESAGKYVYALDGLEAIRREQDPNRLNEMIGAFKTDALAQDSQFRAMAQQADTKWNDNGVLNPGDLVKAIESLGGVDPASFKSILMNNKDIIARIQQTKRGLGMGLQNAAVVYNYRLGSADDMANDVASGGFSSSSQSGPNAPATIDAINTLTQQATGSGVPIVQPNAIRQTASPSQTKQPATKMIIMNGGRNPIPMSAEEADLLIESGDAKEVR